MVKILLDNEVERWVYVPECSCNDAFFTRFRFDHMNTIVKLTKLVICNDFYACPYELLSEVFSERISIYSGATETDQYLNATFHEVDCSKVVRRTRDVLQAKQ
jgi:hypothetical protein